MGLEDNASVVDGANAPGAPQDAAPQAQPQAQPQPQAPPQQQAPAPEPPGAWFKNVGHAMAGAILGTLAGKSTVTGYGVDAAGNTTPVVHHMTAGDQLRKIAAGALTGLAAGSQVEERGSPLADALAGLGAGAAAQNKKMTADDELMRTHAKEDFEQQQKALYNKAVIANHNANTWQITQHMMQEGLDMDPQRKIGMDVADAAEAPESGLTVQRLTPEEFQKQYAADPNFKTDHMWFTSNYKTELGPDGQPVKNPDGSIKQTPQIVTISGLQDGKIKLPSSFVDDIHKYGKYAGIRGYDKFSTDMTVSGQDFSRISALVAASKKAALDAKPDFQVSPDGSKLQRRNPISGEITDANPEEQMKWQQEQSKTKAEALSPEEKQTNIDEKKSIIRKNDADTAKLRADAAAESGAGSDTMGQRLVEADMDPTQLSKRSKDYNAKIEAADKYSMATYGKPWDLAKAQSDYKYATNLSTQNTLKFLDSVSPNLQRVVALSNSIPRTEFKSLNDLKLWMDKNSGNVPIVQYGTAVLETADQIAKILQGGGTSGSGTSDAKLRQANDLLAAGFTTGQINGIAGELFGLLGNRKESMIKGNRYLEKWSKNSSTGSATPAAPAAPPAEALAGLKEGQQRTFQNGQSWTIRNGQPIQVSGPGQAK